MDFANVLFAGPCNRACPFCIGRQLPERVNAANLDLFPPRGLEAFLEAVREEGISEIVFTGTTSDPQLYRHEAELLELLRAELPEETRFSVHTNGVLALRKIETFNAYDRACLSIPSLVPSTYEAMMGSRRVPDLAAILEAATIPVKVSAVVNEHNAGELDEFLLACAGLGVKRAVVRRLFGETRQWPILRGFERRGSFRGNPVYDVAGMECTLWDFDDTAMSSLNLFADGTLGDSYLLTETPALA